MSYDKLATIGTLALSTSIYLIVFGIILLYFSSIGTRWRKYAIWCIELSIIAFASGLLLAIQRDGHGMGATMATVIGGMLAMKYVQWRWGSPKSKSDTYGSAGWATKKELKKKNMLGSDGLRLGYLNKDRQWLHYSGDRHLLTVAPTRAGKGVAAIIPNLLTYEGSAFVIDPKGENAQISMKARQKLGQEVYVVDPWGITGLPVAQFNPLDYLDPDNLDFTEKAMMLADALVLPTEGGNAFFDQEARSLLNGLILYVRTHADEEGKRNLGRVRSLLAMDKDDTDELFQKMYASEVDAISKAGGMGLQKDPKTLANVLASAQTQTAFLDSPHVTNSLSKSDFAFGDLKKKPMTVYLVLPSDRINTFQRWLRLLVQQALKECATDVEMHGNKKRPKSVLFLLDEMAALGRLKMIEEAYGLMAGFRMQLWGIVQNLSQLETIYDKGWETFISNSGVLQYFGSRDKRSAEYFSELCGNTTVQAKGLSEGRSSGPVLPQGSNEGASINDAQRPLIYPDELMVLPDNEQILLVENSNPIRALKARYFEDPELKKLANN